MDKQIKKIRQDFQKIEQSLSLPEVASNPKKLQALSREHKRLGEILTLAEKWEKGRDQLNQAEEMIAGEKDAELKSMAEKEVAKNSGKVEELEKKLKLSLLPPDPAESKDIIIEIRAGAGGNEAGLFAADLFRMYQHFSEKLGFRTSVMHSSRTGIGGFKEVIFEVKGSEVYKHFKFESGVHRVQRVPETEKSGRLHTSTVTVAVLPEAEEVDLNLKPEDIRVDVYRSSGPGGQSVNTTDSAVRVTHLPTGTVVAVQDEKSQFKNKAKALRILRSRILAEEQEKQMQKEASARKNQIGTGSRSEKIRTYNFPQDRLTDHRIKQSWHGLEAIMAGELDNVIQALTEEDNKLKLASLAK